MHVFMVAGNLFKSEAIPNEHTFSKQQSHDLQQEHASNFDAMDNDANGEDRLDDLVRVVAKADRENMFLHLFDEGYGLGTAGPTAQACTSKEVVGATGNAGVIVQDKSSTLQDDEDDNNVAGTRNIANTAYILPAFSHPSCGPKSRREVALFACGVNYPFPPACANEHIKLTEVMIYSVFQILQEPENDLTPSARVIRRYIDPVVAKMLPTSETACSENYP
jgi:hypothetical protein